MALKMDKVNKKNRADEELKKLEQSSGVKNSTTEIITALNNPVKETKTITDNEPVKESPVIPAQISSVKESEKTDIVKKEASKIKEKTVKEPVDKKKVGRPKTKNEEYKRIAVDLSPEVYEMALAINSVTDNNMTLCISNLIKDKYMKNEELYKQIMAFKNKLK